MSSCGRTGSFEAGLTDVRLTGDFSNSGNTGICVNKYDQNVERAVRYRIDDGYSQMHGFNGGDLHVFFLLSLMIDAAAGVQSDV